MDEPSEAELVERCRGGDQDAAQALVERVHPLLLRIAAAHQPRTLALEDLVQEVAFKMFLKLPSYQPREGTPFSHWLSRLAVRTCLDAIRSEQRRPRTQPLPLPDAQRSWLEVLVLDRAPPVEEALAARELVAALLARLPPRDALLLTLLDLEERPLAEVAATTGWNATLIKVRAFRARRRLRACAQALLAEEGGPDSAEARSPASSETRSGASSQAPSTAPSGARLTAATEEPDARP